jgi:predicted ATP-grasp superfamily ATP-dependent carboligase
MEEKEKLTVLIIGADLQTGYTTARSLANLDIQLIGLCSNPRSRFCRSGLWDHIVTVDRSMGAHLEKLIALGKSSSHKSVLFTAQDSVVQLIADNMDELRKYYEFVFPKTSAVDLLTDKTAFHQWAIEHGFPVPESYIAESESELDWVLRNIRFPVVIKPLFRTEAWVKKSGIHKVFKLNHKEEIKDIGFNLLETAPRLLIQRWIPGGDGNVHFCLMYIDRNGREIGYYTGRKLLQWPILTGNTAIGVGTFNHKVHELARDVLLKAELRGLGSLEVKKSDEDNRYYITEPTVGRNNYQSYLAVAGGVNLTQIAFYDAINDHRGIVLGERKKATWIDEHNATQAIGNSNYHLSFYYRNIIRHLSRRVSFTHFNLKDPMPFIFFFSKRFPKPIRKIILYCSRRIWQ